MRRLLLIATLSLLSHNASAQKSDGASGSHPSQPPELRTPKTVTLSPSYGCRAKEEFQKGYEGTALFLSDFEKRMNTPNLLFNGSCGSKDDFDVVTHGGNFSTIADLTAGGSSGTAQVFDSFEEYDSISRREFREAGFAQRVPVKVGHTYVVLVDKALGETQVRGVFIFTVVDHIPNKRVALSYEVKDYQIRKPGFDRAK